MAYGTRLEAHVLNVPAGGMSALADDAEHFLRWAREREPATGAATFVPRRLYGLYLAHALEEAERAAPADAVLERVVGEVRDIVSRPGGPGLELLFTDGSRRTADHVVRRSETTHRAIRLPKAPSSIAATGTSATPGFGIARCIRRRVQGAPARNGATMMDIAPDLAGRGVAIPVRAVSRRGLLPQAHRAMAPAPPDARPPAIEAPPHTARRMLHAVRAHARARAGDWREVIGAMRAETPALWRALPAAERAPPRVVRPIGTCRHRAAPATASAVDRMLRKGPRTPCRASRRFRSTASDVEVTLRPRGRAATERLVVDRVVNCTGPSSDVARVGDLLLDSLLASGRIAPDALRLGLRVADDLALLDAGGTPSEVLSLVGPLLRADFWEATAVPELRAHAARLAARLLP